MQPFSAATVILSLALSVSSSVVTRTNPPAGWNTTVLEHATTTPTTTSINSMINHGVATFFYPNGQPGACGFLVNNADMIVELDVERYGSGPKSPLCGKLISITNTENGKSITVTISGACPTCLDYNSIDLSVAAFSALGSIGRGVYPVSWRFLS